MYDFANSGYTTVVLTAVFGAYFVGVVAGGTAWAGKLVLPSAITPQELGTLRARVCVAGGLTVYVDPKIRGV